MNDEAAFLEAIRADPGDATVRLVYADWLEENEDPRAELVRIEEEVRHLAVFSDRYWLLKPVRQELRSRSPQEWLTAMGYDNASPLLFAHGVPDGWRDRWRLIREYTERWHGIPMADVGGRADEIREAEERLGRALPPSLREWVAFAHDVRRSPFYHDVFQDAYHIQDLEHDSAVSLMLNCEGDNHWLVSYEAFDQHDPPVYGRDLNGISMWDHSDSGRNRRNPPDTTLTTFVLQRAIDDCRGKGGGFSKQAINHPDHLVRCLRETFSLPTNWEGIDFYESDLILVRVSLASTPPLMRIEVELKEPMPREAVPRFLREYARGSERAHGIFATRTLAELENSDEADDIPF